MAHTKYKRGEFSVVFSISGLLSNGTEEPLPLSGTDDAGEHYNLTAGLTPTVAEINAYIQANVNGAQADAAQTLSRFHVGNPIVLAGIGNVRASLSQSGATNNGQIQVTIERTHSSIR